MEVRIRANPDVRACAQKPANLLNVIKRNIMLLLFRIVFSGYISLSVFVSHIHSSVLC